MSPQYFGGSWTEKKLEALESYLKAYLRIFTGNERARRLIRHYVDAFAGSGTRALAAESTIPKQAELLEAIGYMDGSVHKVLSLDQPFHRYHFVEKRADWAAELRQSIRTRYPEREALCEVVVEDANEFLWRWSESLGPMDRGVVFLDPYGMAVKWETIERLAKTQKVDLWMLFPSSSVIRMLPRRGPPDEAWTKRLTELFGTEDWKEEFYKPAAVEQGDLFGEPRQEVERAVTVEAVADYLLKRLERIFAGVSRHPIKLQNSKGSVLFMLCFAVGNPKAKGPALKIAHHIAQHL